MKLGTLRVALVMAILLPAAGRLSAAEARRVMNIAMEDQFRKRHETVAMRGEVVALVYAERRGAEASRDLGRRLHLRFHPEHHTAVPDGRTAGEPATNVRVIAVACLGEIPRPFHGIARSRFRSDSPSMPVWLDFDDTMRRNFGLTAGVPNIAVLDAAGRLHSVHKGAFRGDELEQLAAAINEARALPREPRAAAVDDGRLDR